MINRLILALSFVLLGTISLNAQVCVPDPNHADTIIYPGETQGLPVALLNTPYEAVITVNIPTDTLITFGPTSVLCAIDEARMNSFTGFPAGLSFDGEPVNFTYPGGSSGCIRINGTVTLNSELGDHDLSASLTLFKDPAGSSPLCLLDSITIPVDFYTITVEEPNAIGTIAAETFKLAPNTPNPFSDNTMLQFTSTKSDNFEIKVYNLIGVEVFTDKFSGKRGNNAYQFNANGLSSGIYFYTIGNGEHSASARMIVSNKL